MQFKIIRYRKHDNDYIALTSSVDEVVVDVRHVEKIAIKLGSVYDDRGSSTVLYQNVYFPKTFDLI